MSVHIFTVNEENYEICVKRGLVGLPEPKETRSRSNVFDGLLSRLAVVREDDYILMYVIGTKELRGLWQAEGRPFYDETSVWTDRVYPFRCKIKCSPYYFEKPLKLNDISDLRNSGKLWTWALQRASGSNAMFSISNKEFEILLNEYMKINPFTMSRSIILEPYPVRKFNLMDFIHLEKGQPQYEYSIMALLNDAFARGDYTNIFGNYTDYLSYVPTNLGSEMDVLLMFGNAIKKEEIVSYDIIEVKRSEFGENALTQLIGYESWFLHKKVFGDLNMIRTTAIAKSFAGTVIDYVKSRTVFEDKPIKLVTYDYDPSGRLILQRIL